MRIAIVHSFYGSSVPGGENLVPLDQADALRRAGHEVELVAAHTDELADRPLYALRAAMTVVTGRGRSPLPELRAFAPDVVNIHNLFPNFGRTWVHDWPGPLVVTLHNYRPLCASAVLYRDGAQCTRCLDGDRWAGLRHGCYRDSRLATLPLAWAGRGGVSGDPVLSRADRVVVLTELSRVTYARAGLPRQRTALIPNFVADVEAPTDVRPRATWVYIGKLLPEKGILDLLRRWPADEHLDVIGTGPLESACREVAPASVRFLGTLERAELRRTLPGYQGLVFPSRWLEGLPLVYLEALAAGLPVLAFAGSAVHHAVRAEATGTVTSWEACLSDVLRAATRLFPSLREHCREVYERHYREDVWVDRTVRLYEELASAGPAEEV